MTTQSRSGTGFRNTLWAVVLGVVGVALLAGAGILAQGDVTADVDVEGSSDSVTVTCGSALDAWNLPNGAYVNGDEEIVFEDEADFDVLGNLASFEVNSLLADADDGCRDAARSNLMLSAVIGVIGIAGVVGAVVLARRRSVVADSEMPTPAAGSEGDDPSDQRS